MTEPQSEQHVDESETGERSGRGILLMTLIIGVAAVVTIVSIWHNRSASAADSAVTEHVFDGGRIDWEIRDYPAVALRENTFSLSLSGSEGSPLQGADMQITLEMIDMLCGDYSFKLTETSPGVYTGEGIPLMAGMWKASLTLVQGDGSVHFISRTLRAVH